MMKPEQLNFEDGYRGLWHCQSFPAKSPSAGECQIYLSCITSLLYDWDENLDSCAHPAGRNLVRGEDQTEDGP